MVALAIADNPSFSVSRAEIDREGPTYTVDTLDLLRSRWGERTKVWFILGSDALLDLPNWREPERILELARLAVAARGALQADELVRLDARLPGLGAAVDVVPMPRVEISSSELRHRLSLGVSTRYWLPTTVSGYARERGLYRAPPAVIQSKLGRH
jgi:nicotinate-nucleotide adenylyltransferase